MWILPRFSNLAAVRTAEEAVMQGVGVVLDPASAAQSIPGQAGVPGYLPLLAQPLIPWARRHVARVAGR